MIINRLKLVPLILILITLISVILLTASIWNSHIGVLLSGSILPVLFLFIALISSIGSYILYLKETNYSLIEQKIKLKVDEERVKIYEELNKKEEVVDETKIDLDEIVNQVIPKGNFKNVDSFATKLLQNMGHEFEIAQGLFYLSNPDFTNYKFVAGYALTNKKPIPDFSPGESLNGQVAISKEIMLINDIPKEYFNIESGLGTSKPVNLFIAPILIENNTIAVLEFATFRSNSEFIKDITNKVTYQIANKIVQIQKS
jgi:hypothetical protein